MPENEESYLPLVQVAAFCQLALPDAQGSLSLIRLIDRLPVMGTADEMQPQIIQGITLAIVLKAGFMRGKATLKVVPNTPSGAQMPASETSVLFEGEERGVAFVTPMGFVANEEGLYWFDVLINDVRLTRIPLRVIYQKIRQAG